MKRPCLEVRTVQESFGVRYNKRGLTELWDKFRNLPNALVVCEATGGYERVLLSFLHERSISVCPQSEPGARFRT